MKVSLDEETIIELLTNIKEFMQGDPVDDEEFQQMMLNLEVIQEIFEGILYDNKINI